MISDSIGVYAVLPSIMSSQSEKSKARPSLNRKRKRIADLEASDSFLNALEIDEENTGFCFDRLLEEAIQREEDASDDDDDATEPELDNAGPSSWISHSQTSPSVISRNLITENDEDVAEPELDYAVHHPPPSISHYQPSLSARDVKIKKKSKTHSRVSRQRKRAANREKMPGDFDVRLKIQKKHVHVLRTITSTFQTEEGRFSSTSYIGTNDRSANKLRFILEDLAGPGSLGYRLYQWDGKIAVPITDGSGRVIAVLVGRPDDENWEVVHLSAAQALEDARPKRRFPPKSLNHRRGTYPALHSGVSIGNGQKRPSNLVNDAENEKVVEHLATLSPFKRLAGFSSGESVFR
jgi:hypothetical protein